MILQYITKLLAIKEAIDTSRLYNETTFYPLFIKDLEHAKSEVIIESPFITIERTSYFLSTFKKLVKRGANIYIYTRIIEEQSEKMQYQAEAGIDLLEDAGVFIIQTKGFLHRKLAIIDKAIVWEGSLNILSQRNSLEIMRRINNQCLSEETSEFINFDNKKCVIYC